MSLSATQREILGKAQHVKDMTMMSAEFCFRANYSYCQMTQIVLRYTLTIGAACSSYTVTRCGNAESHSLAVFFNLIVYNATVLKPSSLVAKEDRYSTIGP